MDEKEFSTYREIIMLAYEIEGMISSNNEKIDEVKIDSSTALKALNLLDDVAHGRTMMLDPHWLAYIVKRYIVDGEYYE